jgi:hypothetical protein
MWQPLFERLPCAVYTFSSLFGLRATSFKLQMAAGKLLGLSPADEAGKERHAEIRVMGPDTYCEAVDATFRKAGDSLKQVITSTVLFDRLHLGRDSVNEFARRTEASEIKFNGDVRWFERTEFNACADGNFSTDHQSTFGALLDRLHTDAGPFLAKPGNPYGERFRARRVVHLQCTVVLVRVQINLACIIFHHSMGIDERTDGAYRRFHVVDPLSG